MIFNPSVELHLYCLHIAYMPLINKAIEDFVGQWNNHPVSTECNLSPNQLWIQGMLDSRNSRYGAVSDVTQEEQIDFDNYGIDDDGLVPEEEEYAVVVPSTNIPFTQDQERQQHEIVENIMGSGSDNDGMVSFQVVLEMSQTLLNII